jgi:hypothetical protein
MDWMNNPDLNPPLFSRIQKTSWRWKIPIADKEEYTVKPSKAGDKLYETTGGDLIKNTSCIIGIPYRYNTTKRNK